MNSVIVLDSSDEDEVINQNMSDTNNQLKGEMTEINKQFAFKKTNIKRVENVHNINNNNNNAKVIILNNRVKSSGNESYAITENNIKHTVANKARYSALAKSNVNINATAAYPTNNNVAANSTASITTNYESNNKSNLATCKLKTVAINNNSISVVAAKRPKLSNEIYATTPTTKMLPTKPYSAQNLPPLQPSPQIKNQIRKIVVPVAPVTSTTLSTTVQKNTPVNVNVIKTTPFTMPVVVSNAPVSNFSTLDADMLPPLQLLATPPHQSSALTLETPQSFTTIQNKKQIESNDCILLPAETVNCKINYTTKAKKTSTSAKQDFLATCNKNISLNRDPQNIFNNIVINSKPKIVHYESNGIVDKGLTKSTITQLKKPENDKLKTPSIDLTQTTLKCSTLNNMKSSNQNSNTSNLAENQSKIQKQTNIETSLSKITTTTADSIDMPLSKCITISEADAIATESKDSEQPTVLVEDKIISENEPTTEYTDLLKVLRAADKSVDMENLIEKKLNKYYSAVPYNFTKSRGFRRNMRAVKEAIHREPDLVYFHLKSVLEELKSRYHVKPAQDDEDDAEVITVHSENENDTKSVEATTEETRTDELKSSARESPKIDIKRKHTNLQIQKLNAALHALTKKIEALEQAEVDWEEDDDSSYLQVERLKKRACQIYNKICDLTGESKNAHRLMKKPIKFNGTDYPQFNKTLRAYINRTREFPDYYDVLHMVEHCNNKYEFGLASFQIKRLAEDAFMQVGKLLQARRKTDLYETVSHYTANSADPAKNDPTLLAKLNDNKKVQKRIGDVIAKYAREQDRVTEEQKSTRIKSNQSNISEKSKLIASKIPNIDEDPEDEDEDSSESGQADSSNDSETNAYESQSNNNEKKKTFVWSGVFSKKKLVPHEQETVDKTEKQKSDTFVKNATVTNYLDNRLQNKPPNTTINGCDDLNKTQNFLPELKIVSVCSLKANDCGSSIVSDKSMPLQKSAEKLNSIGQNVSEIWISDDEDELKTGSYMKAT